jgi:ABC-type lipoprotein export system ATPase subunit
MLQPATGAAGDLRYVIDKSASRVDAKVPFFGIASKTARFPDMSGTFNLSFANMEALDMVGLSKRYDHHPNQLSGGQQQRVAIARSLANQPDLLLADEPTGALDSATGIEVLALFQKLNTEGLTVVLVTHDRGVADAARRRIAFRDGRVIEDVQS